MEEGTIVPQIDVTASVANPDAQAMAMTGDTMTDLKSIAAEMGIKLDPNGNVASTQPAKAQPAAVTPSPVPAQPQAPQAQQTTPEVQAVPEKFQNPDGTPNVEKIEKSTVDVLKGIEYYKAKEREFHQLQNKVNNPTPAPVQPQFVQPQNPAQLSPLEYQMAQDLINESAAQGVTLDQRLAIAQARVMARGLEAKHAAEVSITQDLRREMTETKMTAELRDLIDADAELLTPAVADRVLAIKQERGFSSYREAYIQHLGEQVIAQRTGQVKTPNPTGQVAKAPPTPIGPVTRVQPTVNVNDPKSLTNDQLEAEVRRMFPRYRGVNR